ncbi:MAG: sodium/proline symporter [Bacteroidetes bacterium]|nr:sodium/proline symporter [Bacteroidota bacterium]
MDIYKYLILAAYFAVLFVIGILASRRIKGLDDFFVGGKNMGFWLVSFSSRATGESAWLLLGLSGLAATIGYKSLWVVAGEMLGVGLSWVLMAKPFKRLTDKYQSITIPDFFEDHLKPKGHALRLVAATALTLFVIIYVSAQIDATGSAFESFLGWDYLVGAVVGFAIVVVYSFIGGYVAVVWSDVFQGALMLLGLVALPLVAITQFSFTSLGAGLKLIDPGLTSAWGTGGLTALNFLSAMGLLFIGLGYLGAPQVFVRFISVKNEKELDKGKWVAIAYTLLANLGAIGIGLLARVVFRDQGIDALGKGGEGSLMLMIERFMPPIMVGVYIAVVLSAIMSTIDSLLVVAASTVTRDFYHKIFHPHMKQETMANLSRRFTLIMALVALALAICVATLSPNRTVFWFVIFGWSGITATFCPSMILSLGWRRFTANGALASMIVGFAAVPLFKFAMPALPVMGPYFAELGEIFPSFILSLLAGIMASLWPTRHQEASGTGSKLG